MGNSIHNKPTISWELFITGFTKSLLHLWDYGDMIRNSWDIDGILLGYEYIMRI
jgi:hypothetical protein